MTARDKAERQAALTRLAVATQHRLPERGDDRDAFFRVYLDDLEKFSNDTFVKACRLLERRVSWFPKKHELLEACQTIVQRKADERSAQRRLPEGRPVDPPKLEDFKRRVAEHVKTRGMDAK